MTDTHSSNTDWNSINECIALLTRKTISNYYSNEM